MPVKRLDFVGENWRVEEREGVQILICDPPPFRPGGLNVVSRAVSTGKRACQLASIFSELAVVQFSEMALFGASRLVLLVSMVRRISRLNRKWAQATLLTRVSLATKLASDLLKLLVVSLEAGEFAAKSRDFSCGGITKIHDRASFCCDLVSLFLALVNVSKDVQRLYEGRGRPGALSMHLVLTISKIGEMTLKATGAVPKEFLIFFSVGMELGSYIHLFLKAREERGERTIPLIDVNL